jgi:cytochrome c-type biogenesis protein CcmH
MTQVSLFKLSRNHLILPAFCSLILSALILTALILTSMAFWSNAYAAIENREFETTDQEALYKELIFELRCPKCQNQNIADSNAELATDLRDKVYDMVSDGKNKNEITTFMLDRFGEFVLYKPQFEPKTWLLWLGPFFLLAIVLIAVWRLVQKNAKALDLNHDCIFNTQWSQYFCHCVSKNETS